jgi:hypothetical protein
MKTRQATKPKNENYFCQTPTSAKNDARGTKYKPGQKELSQTSNKSTT